MQNRKVDFDIDEISHIHFVGIGGVSMSALAYFFLKRGARVSGSDIKENEAIEHLKALGAKIYLRHKGSNIVSALNLVVYSSAINRDNIELIEARLKGVKIISRGELLKHISKKFESVIAISGTHGKTTTTALLSYILKKANLNAFCLVGGGMKNKEIIKEGNKTNLIENHCILPLKNAEILKKSAVKSAENYFEKFVQMGQKRMVYEACEYHENFLYTRNDFGVILNVEREHLDYFKEQKNHVAAYKKFAQNSSAIVCEKGLCSVLELDKLQKNKNVITVSLDKKDATFYAGEIKRLTSGGYAFNIYFENKKFLSAVISILGRHNIFNALCAVAVAHFLGADKKAISNALCSFSGVEKRLEKIKEIDKCVLIRDYAHHPTEIDKTIKELKSFYGKNLLVIFEPHTYSRTLDLYDEFKDMILKCNIDFILTPTYSAREDKERGISAKELYTSIKDKKENLLYMSKNMAVRFARKNAKLFSCIAFVGAGWEGKIRI